MAIRLMMLALVLALSGCARYQWQKPGATEAEFKMDAYNCEKDMRQSGYYGGGLAGAIEAIEFEHRCMEAHGYTQVQVNQRPLKIYARASA